jgi:hypothetical protein
MANLASSFTLAHLIFATVCPRIRRFRKEQTPAPNILYERHAQ